MKERKAPYLLLTLLFSIGPMAGRILGQIDVLTYRYDNGRSGD